MGRSYLDAPGDWDSRGAVRLPRDHGAVSDATLVRARAELGNERRP